MSGCGIRKVLVLDMSVAGLVLDGDLCVLNSIYNYVFVCTFMIKV